MLRTRMIAVLVMLLMTLLAQGVSYAYWMRDNHGPILSPEADYQPEWIADADFRERTHADASVHPGWEVLRPYYATSPDGRWHVAAVQRGSRPWLRTWLADTMPIAIISLIGLGICLGSRRPGKTDPDFA